MHNFKELEVWNNSMDLATSIYKVTEFFPQEERFGITSQMRRASVSIPSLIAEGAGRNTNKDFANFIGMAIGSCYELETQLILSSRLNSSGTPLGPFGGLRPSGAWVGNCQML